MLKSTTGVEHYEPTENKRVFPEEVPSFICVQRTLSLGCYAKQPVVYLGLYVVVCLGCNPALGDAGYRLHSTYLAAGVNSGSVDVYGGITRAKRLIKLK